MILGFGTTETTFEQAFAADIYRVIREANKGEEIAAVEAFAERHNAESDAEDKKPRGECKQRYTSVYCWTTEPKYFGFNVAIRFIHVNRDHPFSPDGVAALGTKGILAISRRDGANYFRNDSTVASPDEVSQWLKYE